MNKRTLLLLTVGLLGQGAWAGLTCSSYMIAENRERPTCASFSIPNRSAITSSFLCNKYRFTVEADLRPRPHQLKLSIVAPDGQNISTSNEDEVSLIDDKGNGALLRCLAD